MAPVMNGENYSYKGVGTGSTHMNRHGSAGSPESSDTESESSVSGEDVTAMISRGNTAWVTETMIEAVHNTEAMLSRISGEPGDVEKDPYLAFGESALTFQDVSFSVRAPRATADTVILEPCSGHFEPGTLVALMGPSGCGKTTLLDILADKKCGPCGGIVHFNGRPRDKLYRRMVAYVAQSDIMPATMSVEESIRFVYDLKQPRPAKLSASMQALDIESRLHALGLSQVKTSWIGSEQVRGISGGQRRRVSLARGLVSGAQIIFADEPTSGLSASDAETCIRYMRLVAHRFDVTIVVVIHQPRVEVARLFDHLLLLASQPGRLVYNGPMMDAAKHWAAAGCPVPGAVNPTDYFLDLVTPGMPLDRADHLLDYYGRVCAPELAELVAKEMCHERQTCMELLNTRRDGLLLFGHLPPVRRSVYAVGFRIQLRVVFHRQLQLAMRDKMGARAEIIGALAKGILIGIAFLDIGNSEAVHQLGFIFMLLATASIDGLKIMPKIISERTIMKVETDEAFYSPWAYIVAFTVINTLLTIVCSLLFIIIVWWFSNLRWALFPETFMWTLLLQFTFDSLYLMVSAIAPDATSAQIMALPFLMVFLLYNGFTCSKTTTPWFMQWAIQISPMAYDMETISLVASSAARPSPTSTAGMPGRA